MTPPSSVTKEQCIEYFEWLDAQQLSNEHVSLILKATIAHLRAPPEMRESENADWVPDGWMRHVRVAVQSLAFQVAQAEVLKRPSVFDSERLEALEALRELLPENRTLAARMSK